jgi:hypothetical protein
VGLRRNDRLSAGRHWEFHGRRLGESLGGWWMLGRGGGGTVGRWWVDSESTGRSTGDTSGQRRQTESATGRYTVQRPRYPRSFWVERTTKPRLINPADIPKAQRRLPTKPQRRTMAAAFPQHSRWVGRLNSYFCAGKKTRTLSTRLNWDPPPQQLDADI